MSVAQHRIGWPTEDVSYNGFTFPYASRIKLTSTPIYDNANRLVKYVTYLVRIEFEVLPDDPPTSDNTKTVDANMENLRARLTRPGKVLKLKSIGLGTNLEVNTSPQTRDVEFGPKPQVVQLEPVGWSKAWRVEWLCEFSIPECENGYTGPDGATAEFTYEINRVIDESGLTTRTISGTFEIPIGWNGNQAASHIDYRLEAVKVAVIPGFHRKRTWSISRDKRTLDFLVTDSEINSDNPYYPGIVHASCQHRINARLMEDGFNNWHGGFTGTFTIAPHSPRGVAWDAFAWIVQSRMQYVTRGVLTNSSTENQISQPAFWLPQSFTLEEDVFSRDFNFSFTYTLFCSLESVIQGSGLFTPIPGAWGEWSASLVRIQQNRGYSNIRSGDPDLRIDLCTKNENAQALEYSNRDKLGYFVNRLRLPPVTPQNSWQGGRLRMQLIEDTQVSMQRPLLRVRNLDQVIDKAIQNNRDYQQPIVQEYRTRSEAYQETAQVRGPSTYRALVQFQAMRVGYPIPVPRITSVAGQPPIILKKSFLHDQLSTNPIYPTFVANYEAIVALPRGLNGSLEVRGSNPRENFT